MIAHVLVFFAALGVALAYIFKYRFSGRSYNKLIAASLVFLNGFCVLFYIDLTQRDCMLFFKCFPGLMKNDLIVEIVATAAIFLHCFAIPTQWEPWRLFRIRRKIR